MEAEHITLGTTGRMNGLQVLLLLERAVSEGLASPEESGSSVYNLWGREVQEAHHGGLSFVAGLAQSGLRAAFIGQQTDANLYLDPLGYARRQMLGMVLHLMPGEQGYASAQPPSLSASTDWLQLRSQDLQQAIDFAVIAHRVAELTLGPVLHVLEQPHITSTEGMASLPDAKTLAAYLGDPDEHFESPTPAQQMLLGRHRRRLPNWFSFDTPTLGGMKKDAAALQLETTAQQLFFQDPQGELLAQAFREWGELTGRYYSPVMAYQVEDARYLLLTQGMDFSQVKAQTDKLRKESHSKVGCLSLTCSSPFPKKELLRILAGKKGLTILEPLHSGPRGQAPLFQAVMSALEEGKAGDLPVFSGSIAGDVAYPEFTAVLDNMSLGAKGKRNFVLGISLTRKGSTFPKQEILLQTLNRLYPNLEDAMLAVKKDPVSPPPPAELDLPFGVRQYQDKGAPFSRLSRFFDHTAHFYQQKQRDEQVADPFQALATAPPVSAQFDNYSVRRTTIPVFKPEACTGCGLCYIHCPHAALPPLAIGVEALVKAAMDLSARQGRPVSSLTPLVKNLARIAGKTLRKKEFTVSRVADFLPAAFEELAAQLDPGKRESVRQDFEAVSVQVSEMPVAVTENFFHRPEAQEKGAGELFTLAVDPHACTACGICADICPEDALEMQEQQPDLLARARENFRLWEQLPDTPGATLTRMHHQGDYDPFAAILLSRNFYTSLSGGGEDREPVSKTLLHLVTAVTESLVQPRLLKQADTLDTLTQSLGEQVHKQLSDALPHDNFDHLTQVLETGTAPKLSFGEMAGKLDKLEHSRLLDKDTLLRKLGLLENLKQLRNLITQGPTGTGRARFGIVMPEGAAMNWATRFPFNPFTAPVLLSRDSLDLEQVQGLIQGQVRHLLDNIKLIRRAQLELRNQYEPDSHDEALSKLNWQDLDTQEKAFIPPILLVGQRKGLKDHHIQQLQGLLASGWPVKVLLLDDAPETPEAFAQRTAMLASVLAQRKTFVLQGSLADARHLFSGLQEGLESTGPAFFLLLEAEPGDFVEAGISAPEIAKIARDTRVFPLLRYRPESGYLSTELSLEGNPAMDKDWLEENDALTFADWAFRRKAWRQQFVPFQDEMGKAVSLGQFLEKSEAGAIPVIQGVDVEQSVVPEGAVAAARSCRDAWRTLQELAGQRAAFPIKLREAVEQELNEAHAKELEALRAEYETQLQTLEQEHLEKIRVRIKENLMNLGRMRDTNFTD